MHVVELEVGHLPLLPGLGPVIARPVPPLILSLSLSLVLVLGLVDVLLDLLGFGRLLDVLELALLLTAVFLPRSRVR